MSTSFEWLPARDARRVRRFVTIQTVVGVGWLVIGVVLLWGADRALMGWFWVGLGVVMLGIVAGIRRGTLRADDRGISWQGALRSGSVAWHDLANVSLSWRRGWVLVAEQVDGASFQVGRDLIDGLHGADGPRDRFVQLLEDRAEQHGFGLELANFTAPDG